MRRGRMIKTIAVGLLLMWSVAIYRYMETQVIVPSASLVSPVKYTELEVVR